MADRKPKKKRVVVPADPAAEILFAADHTCCICNTPGLPVQIHHIDDGPSNNDPSNLAVLCEHDHNRTMLSGGFGCHLRAPEVRMYRDDWNKRVLARRARADELAAETMSRAHAVAPPAGHDDLVLPPLSFISLLPAYRAAARRAVAELWSGTTIDMIRGCQEYIDALEAMLVALAAYFPARQFGDEPRRYFSEMIASRFTWHHAHIEPEGPGTGGSIVPIETGLAVINDVEQMIVDLVGSLATRQEEYAFEKWQQQWNAAGTSQADDA